jgi:hypothetical protein
MQQHKNTTQSNITLTAEVEDRCRCCSSMWLECFTYDSYKLALTFLVMLMCVCVGGGGGTVKEMVMRTK